MKIFKEEQRFTQWFLWLILISILLLFMYGTIQQVFFNISFGNRPMSNTGALITTILFSFFVVLFKFLRLNTVINECGISYKFFPINKNHTLITWKNMAGISIIKYRPNSEYGGWGLKHGSYTVKGNIAIKIQLKNGETLIIGTQKASDVKKVLKTYETQINSSSEK